MRSALAVLWTTALTGAWAFNLTPPANTWAVLEQSFNLSCKSSSPLTSCAWTTPYGKNYPLAKGQTAEGGRLRHLGGEDAVCGIAVAGAEERDLGTWICTVSVVNGSEVIPAEGRAKVAEARAPDAVELFGPFENGSVVANVSRSDTVDVECVVNGARPKPEVSWFVDEEELDGGAATEKEDGDVYVYRLAYAPKPDHENKSLRCVVGHVTLETEREAGVLVVFNDLVSETLSMFVLREKFFSDRLRLLAGVRRRERGGSGRPGGGRRVLLHRRRARPPGVPRLRLHLGVLHEGLALLRVSLSPRVAFPAERIALTVWRPFSASPPGLRRPPRERRSCPSPSSRPGRPKGTPGARSAPGRPRSSAVGDPLRPRPTRRPGTRPAGSTRPRPAPSFPRSSAPC